MFARNRVPKPDHVIRFITPQYDPALNGKGCLRIDSKSAEPVELATLAEFPWIWKALAVGTPLDFDVVRKLKAGRVCRLKTYWEEDLDLSSCNGYQLKRDQKPQLDATFFNDLPDLNDTGLLDFALIPCRMMPGEARIKTK